MRKIKIFSLLMCFIISFSTFGIVANAETNPTYTPSIKINSVGFAKATELCQINIFIYDFDKIALNGGIYNLRFSLPEILSVETVYRYDDIISDGYKISSSNVLTLLGEFHYDNNQEFEAVTRYTLLCKIKEDALPGKYEIFLQKNSMLIEDNGELIDYDCTNGDLRITASEDYIAGDINNNELIEADDMLLLKKHLLSIENNENIITDTTADGFTDIRDMIFLKKYLVSTSPNIYLSAAGDDRNSGSDISSPVRTLNKALELVAHNGRINIIDTYSIGNNFKWNHHFKNVIISGGELDITSQSTFLLADNCSFENINIKVTKGNTFCTGGYQFNLGKGAAFSDQIVFSTDQKPTDAPSDNPTDEPTDDPFETDGNTNKTGFPIVNKKETLSVMCVTRTDLGDIANSEFSKDYSEMTNIDIDWKIYSESAISGQKVLALQSGNLPDIMFTSLTDDEMLQYSNEGAFFEFTKDILKEWAPNIYATYNKYPEAWENATNSEGKIFILPGLIKDFNYAEHYWFVNVKWLQKLGMSKSYIRTMDDFYNMLIAFRDGDPNGNGQQDEVPLAIWHHGGFITNPWGFTDPIAVSNSGKVTNMYTTANMKNAVSFWAKIYKEDLVSKKEIDNWAGNNAAFMTLINTGKVGCFFYGWPNMEDALMNQYETLPYPTSKEGNGDFPAQAINVTPFINNGNILISSKCKNVTAALRWIDYLFTDDGYMLKEYGSVGKAYKKLSDGNYEFTGTPTSEDAGPKWSLRCRNYLEDSIIVNDTPDILTLRRADIDAWCEKTLMTNNQKFLPTNWMTKDEINATKLYTPYWSSVKDSWWNFVKGAKNMSSDWTTLINEMKAKGMNKYIEVLQGYYDRCNQ